MALEGEKYQLGYGVAGKGEKAPWYLTKPSSSAEDALDEGAKGSDSSNGIARSAKRSRGKKLIEKLREERVKREKREKEREQVLLASMGK